MYGLELKLLGGEINQIFVYKKLCRWNVCLVCMHSLRIKYLIFLLFILNYHLCGINLAETLNFYKQNKTIEVTNQNWSWKIYLFFWKSPHWCNNAPLNIKPCGGQLHFILSFIRNNINYIFIIPSYILTIYILDF